MDMDYDEPIEPVEDVLRDIRSELQEINREMQDSANTLNNLYSALAHTTSTDYHPWFFILTVMLATLLYRLW